MTNPPIAATEDALLTTPAAEIAAEMIRGGRGLSEATFRKIVNDARLMGQADVGRFEAKLDDDEPELLRDLDGLPLAEACAALVEEIARLRAERLAVRRALNCREGDDAAEKALDGVAKRIGLLDDLAEQTSIVDEMVRSAARGSLAGDYARGWTCAVDEVKRRMASILARRQPTVPELPAGGYVGDRAPRPGRRAEYQMMVEHIAANPKHVSVAPGRRDGALISCVTCGYVPRNDLSAFAPKPKEVEPPRFHCDETDHLCTLIQAWGATNVTGDYITGELRWTSATANVRCYIGPERFSADHADSAPWGFSATAMDLRTDEKRVAHPCIRPTRELAIADAEALVDLMVAARPS